jgi:hypothetical protein
MNEKQALERIDTALKGLRMGLEEDIATLVTEIGRAENVANAMKHYAHGAVVAETRLGIMAEVERTVNRSRALAPAMAAIQSVCMGLQRDLTGHCLHHGDNGHDHANRLAVREGQVMALDELRRIERAVTGAGG